MYTSVVMMVGVCVAMTLLCGSVAECATTPAYDLEVLSDQTDLKCGEKVQIITGKGFMGCYQGPSVKGYNKGGAILTYDTTSNVSAITGVNNQSRVIGYGYEFVVKGERGDGQGVNLGSLLHGKNQIYLEVRNRAYFVDIDEVGWNTVDAKIDMSLNGTIVLVASPGYNSGGGIAKYYRLEGDSYSFKSNIFPSTNQTDIRFGWGLSITSDGGRVAISAPGFDGTETSEGRIFVFHYSSSLDTFEETQILSFKNGSNPLGDLYGESVMISSSGSRLIGCSPTIDLTSANSGGACVVYSYDDATKIYSYSQLLVASDRSSTGKRFGKSVSMSSDEQRIVVSSFFRGRAYFFQYSPGNASYVEMQILQHPNGTGGGYGRSVALSPDGNLLIVGAPNLRLNGFIRVGGSYIYEYQNGSSEFVLSNRYEPSLSFYTNMHVTDEMELFMNREGGFVFQPFTKTVAFPSRYFFFEDDLVWKSIAIGLPSGVVGGDWYGYTVATSLSNRFIATSALKVNASTSREEGAVYLFEIDAASSEYVERYILYGNTSQSGSYFGSSLAFHPSEEMILIGCEGLDVNTTRDGAVFIYSITNTSYSLLTRLSSPSPSGDGYYGSSLFLSSSYLGVGARQEVFSNPPIKGALHLYAVNANLSNINHLQTLFLNDSGSAFGTTIAISPDESKIVVGAPTHDRTGGLKPGAVAVFSYDGNQFLEYDLIVPLDVQANNRIGDYMSISSDGNQILIGSPKHDVNGTEDAGQVYHYSSLSSSRLNGSEHYELEEVLYSPDGVLARSLYGMGVSIHPTLNITLIGCGLSNQQDRDRATVFIYEESKVRNVTSTTSSGSSTAEGGTSGDSFPLGPMLGGLGGGLVGFLLLMCYCFCCVMVILCVVFLIIILLILVVFIVLVGLGGTGTVIGLMRGGDDAKGMCYSMDIINEGMPEYKELKGGEIKLVKQIGEGAFGVVFLGEWRGIDVAVKRIHANQLDEEAMGEFHHEAKVMGKMGNHPNVCGFIGAVTEDGMMLVTRFYHNGSLEDYLIKNKTPTDSNTLLKMARDAACGLLHLHEEGIIHRDIATRNMLVSSNLTVVVTDFGLSRLFATEETQSQQTQTTIGPIRWMSPEMLQSQTYSKSSDCWMFGVMLYEMWEKKQPFEGEQLYNVMIKVKERGEHVRIPKDAPKPFVKVMRGVFKEDPAERMSMKKIYKVLSQALEEGE